MRSILPALVLLTLACSTAHSQARGQRDPAFTPPRFDLAVGYNHVEANAPPGGCPCFGLNGVYLAGTYHAMDHLSVAGQFGQARASKISGLGQNLSLLTFLAGPRATLPLGRLVPFGEFLLGAAHASDSYFPSATTYSTSASSFAFALNGGLDVNLNRRFAVQVVKVGYLRTYFPNGSTNAQNQLTIGAGLVVKIH